MSDSILIGHYYFHDYRSANSLCIHEPQSQAKEFDKVGEPTQLRYFEKSSYQGFRGPLIIGWLMCLWIWLTEKSNPRTSSTFSVPFVEMGHMKPNRIDELLAIIKQAQDSKAKEIKRQQELELQIKNKELEILKIKQMLVQC